RICRASSSRTGASRRPGAAEPATSRRGSTRCAPSASSRRAMRRRRETSNRTPARTGSASSASDVSRVALRPRPGLELGLARGTAALCVESRLQRLTGPEQPAADRGRLDLEHLGKLIAIEVLPVIQLEQNLLLERQRRQRGDQARAVLALDEPG